MADQLTLADPSIQACPFSTYARMREASPIYLDPVTKMYVVTSFELARKIAADHATFSNDTRQLQNRDTPARGEIMRLLTEADFLPVNTLVTNDPPDHRRFRSLVDKAFNLKRVQAVDARVADICDELIARFPDGAFDFVPAFAIKLPMQVIAEQMGVPPEMGDTFKVWSDATLEQADFNITPQRQIECVKLQLEMFQFFWARAQELRQAPNDTLISDLSNAKIDDRLLTHQELTSLLLQILVAGNETTTNALAMGVHTLCERTDLQDALRASPVRIPAFVEEVLRLGTPLQGLFRRVTKPTTMGGVDLPEGAILNVRWAAANRDPSEYPNPDAIDLERPNLTQHLTFGFGVHYCIGNQLARLELRRGFEALLRQSTSIALADGDGAAVWRPHFIARGLSRLNIRFARA
ncbi:MAG: cytochrome P450 [Hyphomonadaceae bacterium]